MVSTGESHSLRVLIVSLYVLDNISTGTLGLRLHLR